MTWLFGTTNCPDVHNIKKLLPSPHQHRINIDTVKHVHTKPYIFAIAFSSFRYHTVSDAVHEMSPN